MERKAPLTSSIADDARRASAITSSSVSNDVRCKERKCECAYNHREREYVTSVVFMRVHASFDETLLCIKTSWNSSRFLLNCCILRVAHERIRTRANYFYERILCYMKHFEMLLAL